MTAADVKFSIDDARAQAKGWGVLDAAIKSIDAPDPSTVVFNLKFPWRRSSPTSPSLRTDHPKNFGGETRKAFYKHPVGTGPFMWDKRVVGQSVTFKRNPYYWQKASPISDSVTWDVRDRREHA